MKSGRPLLTISFLACNLVLLALPLMGGACAALSSNTNNSPNAEDGGHRKMAPAEKARLYVQIATANLMDGDLVGSLQALVLAEQIDDQLPEIYHTRALVFYKRNDIPQAIENARKAVKLAPKYSDAKNTLGRLLMDSGHTQEAIGPLTEAAQDPLYRDAFKPATNLGILYYRQGDYSKARTNLDQAIFGSPNFACVAYYYRGNVDLKESRFRDAVGDYDHATRKFCGGFGEAYVALGIAYEQNHQYDKARRKFIEIEQRFPNSKLADQAVAHLRQLP